jgi:N4-gp56 family major capsid protein
MPESFNVGLNTTTINYFQKKVHRRLRKQSLAEQLSSEGANSAIEKVTELNNTPWGYQAYLTLVPDDTSGGVVGDNRLQDREQAITSHDQALTFDLHRKAFMNEGTMADRSTWLKFAQLASDQLTYWAADMRDKLMMNTLAGVGYEYELDGSLRDTTKFEWSINRYAGDVSAPSSNRHFQVTDTSGTVGAVDHDTLLATHVPKWDSFIEMRAALPMMRVKPIRGKWGNGMDMYVCIVHPYTMAQLKKDSTFQSNLRDAQVRGDKNPIFYGAETYMVDGILLISHRYAYSTLGAASGSKWGSGGTINGARSIFLGAQAMGMVEIGGPVWKTRQDDYDNRMGISMAVKLGMKKLVWPDQYAGNSNEDFGVVCLDHAVTPVGGLSYTV